MLVFYVFLIYFAMKNRFCRSVVADLSLGFATWLVQESITI